ncbi:hypothetical protein SNOG_14942 [Parastagonospora nodorum SN15]|uniref:Uncharacterized protein n=1 Tax=Phaeosphaeria nodorum (strain SN15 / ATCC MYA-4574 / FGSC 10173) TaxID=321614 RepID=Q0U085_PHANO|nr:hypothetical protein SNOG_14942 [Parastagonospora nodorum SN15]EAT77794.1 hypothetical protein SNOG_14942 [Parastagonospora nodorum SN15]
MSSRRPGVPRPEAWAGASIWIRRLKSNGQ